MLYILVLGIKRVQLQITFTWYLRTEHSVTYLSNNTHPTNPETYVYPKPPSILDTPRFFPIRRSHYTHLYSLLTVKAGASCLKSTVSY